MKKLLILFILICSSVSYGKYLEKRVGGTGYINGKPVYNVFGLKLDLSIPSGLGASFTARPLKFFQIELGGTTTLVGGGVRAGFMVFVPWHVSPAIHVEGGKSWSGNLNDLVVLFGGQNPNILLLNDVQYEYVNFLGSIGVGHKNWFMVRLETGYTYIAARTAGLQNFIQNITQNDHILTKEATIKLWVPTASFSLQFYFY